MLYPSLPQLLEKIDNRYLLVNAIATRAREIVDSGEEAGDTEEKKSVTCAIEEIANGTYTVKQTNE